MAAYGRLWDFASDRWNSANGRLWPPMDLCGNDHLKLLDSPQGQNIHQKRTLGLRLAINDAAHMSFANISMFMTLYIDWLRV